MYENEILTAQKVFRDIDTPNNFDLYELVESLIKTDAVKGYTDLYDWIYDDSDLSGMTPAQIANEWDELE